MLPSTPELNTESFFSFGGTNLVRFFDKRFLKKQERKEEQLQTCVVAYIYMYVYVYTCICMYLCKYTLCLSRSQSNGITAPASPNQLENKNSKWIDRCCLQL